MTKMKIIITDIELVMVKRLLERDQFSANIPTTNWGKNQRVPV